MRSKLKISISDALALFQKWNSDSTEIVGILEGVLLNPVLKFRGVIAVLSNDGLAVKGEPSFELFIKFSEVEFEYQDSREAPPRLGEWAASNFVGLLVVTSQFWRCSFFERSE